MLGILGPDQPMHAQPTQMININYPPAPDYQPES